MLQASYIVLATISGGIFFQELLYLSCISPKSPMYLPCVFLPADFP